MISRRHTTLARQVLQQQCVASCSATTQKRFESTTTTTTNKVLLPKSLGVIGAGQMGTGIAYVGAVNAKVPVVLMDANEQSLIKSVDFICK
jgi:lactate dehydrogenase-like 2-hydroxyacid dehydrogenase